MRVSLAAALLFASAAAPLAANEITKDPLFSLPNDALANGVAVYLSPRVTASATGLNRPEPIVIGRAPETFHCAISDMVILQSGRQPALRNGSRACSVFLEDNLWMLRVRNVQMEFKEGLNTRVECQAICMETAQ